MCMRKTGLRFGATCNIVCRALGPWSREITAISVCVFQSESKKQSKWKIHARTCTCISDSESKRFAWIAAKINSALTLWFSTGLLFELHTDSCSCDLHSTILLLIYADPRCPQFLQSSVDDCFAFVCLSLCQVWHSAIAFCSALWSFVPSAMHPCCCCLFFRKAAKAVYSQLYFTLYNCVVYNPPQ